MNEKKNFDYKKLHPFKWYILENFPFLEDSIDVLTNYQLFCKLGEMYNKEVDAINTLGIQVEGITDWFDNLDVQDEVNNKLDEMAESGELEEIIASYLNTKALICFDTVSDMKLSENLVNGSYAKTLGYNSKNDGGTAVYKIRTITNDDVVNEMNIIALYDNSLIAELIEKDSINVNKLGIFGDNTTDVTTKLQFAIDNFDTIYLPAGIYKTSSPLQFKRNSQTLKGENRYLSKISNSNSNIIDTNGKLYLSIYDLGLISDDHTTGYSAIMNSGARSARSNFERLYIYDISYGIKFDSGYSDGLVIFDIKFETVEYCINLMHAEGCTIKQLIAEPFIKNFVRIYQSNACEISNCIANGSQSSMSNTNKILFLIYGSLLDNGQILGSNIYIHDIHAEFIHSIGFIATRNTTLKDIYVYNGGITTNLNWLYLAKAGNLQPNNLKIDNIILDRCDNGENRYEIYVDSSGHVNLVDVYPISTAIGNIMNIDVNNWNCRTEFGGGSNYRTTYHLKYGMFEMYNGGKLFITDSVEPTLTIPGFCDGRVFRRTSFTNGDLWTRTGASTKSFYKYNGSEWIEYS